MNVSEGKETTVEGLVDLPTNRSLRTLEVKTSADDRFANKTGLIHKNLIFCFMLSPWIALVGEVFFEGENTKKFGSMAKQVQSGICILAIVTILTLIIKMSCFRGKHSINESVEKWLINNPEFRRISKDDAKLILNSQQHNHPKCS